MTRFDMEIWKSTTAFILYEGELLATFSKKIGAYEKFLAILFKCDSLRKITTGNETFKIFLH